MGTTIRREPNLTDLPKKVTPHYENVLNFKGLHITDNPFTADPASASDMLNVYIDDNNALTVRPRLEKDTDYDTVVGDYTLVKVEPLKNGKILLLLNGTTPVVKLVINNTTYTVSGVGTLNVNTCNFYEDGDISVDGKIYLFDENGAKYIAKSGSAYVCDSISNIAYVPTVEINKDLTLNKSRENEPYNAFSSHYKVSYVTPIEPYAYGVDFAVGKKATIITSDVEYTTNSFIKQHSFLTKGVLHKQTEQIHNIASSSNGQILVYTTDNDKCYISTDYGKNFKTLECKNEDSEKASLLEVEASNICISGDGKTILTVTSNGVLKLYRNYVLLTTVDLKEGITVSSTTYKIHPTYFVTNLHLSISSDGNVWCVTPMYKYTNSALDGGIQYLAIFKNTWDSNNTLIVTKSIINFSGTSTNDSNDSTRAFLNSTGDYCAVLYNQRDPSIDYVAIINTQNSTITRTAVADAFDYDTNFLWLNNNVFVAMGIPKTLITIKVTSETSASVTVSTNTYTVSDLTDYGSFVLADDGLYYVQDTSKIALKFTISNGNLTGAYTSYSLLTDFHTYYSDDRKNVTCNGFIYILSGDRYTIYSNNGFSLDKDWIAVEYTDHASEYKINKSTNYAIWRDSLWLYGYKNQLSWSGFVNGKRDFTYAPENQIFELSIDTTPVGETSDITGFNIIGDSVASAYKRDRIFLITPTTINDIDTYIYSECKAEQGNDTMGQTVVTPLTALPIQVNRDGVFALTNLTNVYAADKVATLISAKINDKFLKEDLSNIKLISFKYWLFIFIPGDISKVYVYDDRAAEWYYWELPIKVLNIFKTHDNLYCVGDDNVVFKFNPKEKIVSIDSNDAVTLYYDDVYVDGADNCFDAYGVQGKNIVWYWASQILPLNSVSYAKQLNKTTFIVADSDVTDGYAFNFSIKGWRKKRTLVKSSDLDGTVYSVQATTKRTNINRAHFIQLTVTNAMLENHQLVLSKTLKTDIDTNDQKVRLVGVSFKFKYLEV